MDDEVSGRNAETRKRQTGFTRPGKKKADTPEDKARKEREAQKQTELEDKYRNWNRGVAQLEMASCITTKYSINSKW